MGGTMAGMYAATRPEKVRRLGLIEGLGPPDMSDQAVTRPRRFATAMKNLPSHTPMESVAYAASRIRRFTPSMSEPTSLRLAERVTTPHEDGCIWSWDALHRSPNPLPFSAERFAQSTLAIECEVLHIDGANSIFLPPDLAQRMKKVPHLTCETLPGGHMLHHDVPGALAERLKRFFE
jgi:pimeloyl-ACP methyl ester carboxylesterase